MVVERPAEVDPKLAFVNGTNEQKSGLW
ncbi:protein of unknown function [Pseudomonas sp. JV551A1]|nr:protein of unknown function [Pseudomonas sp. JV551A1]